MDAPQQPRSDVPVSRIRVDSSVPIHVLNQRTRNTDILVVDHTMSSPWSLYIEEHRFDSLHVSLFGSHNLHAAELLMPTFLQIASASTVTVLSVQSRHASRVHEDCGLSILLIVSQRYSSSLYPLHFLRPPLWHVLEVPSFIRLEVPSFIRCEWPS